ncbi:MAG: DUF3536 domain-containing protein [Acidobacteriota bacterium]
MSRHHVCVHGHFYQPPRENPWLETIELQDAARPHHDWNERITFECYAPNAFARILDREDRIEKIVSNYARISFNFGPTLLSWMEPHAPKVYEALLEADRRSLERFGGHGNAIAQAYNHMILPLASARDRVTQVRWGIRDFEHRFRRPPEGMWLPETAVDTASLEVLAAEGIRFTILAPRQARRFRRIGERGWTDVEGGHVPSTVPYRVVLPSGAAIAVFFYDGPVSQAIAFEGLLGSGDRLADRLLGSLATDGEHPQIASVATDGETYGHHQKHGEMALAYALERIDRGSGARLTNYGEYLERHPPDHEVEIVERSSWSCEHGVERWRSDCGCRIGAHPGWDQRWRGPLRQGLDGLRDDLAPRFEEAAGRHLRSPWEARDDYVELLLDRGDAAAEAFWSRHAVAPLDDASRVQVRKLLEMQRNAMLMYTSCGWFFDEISGIETVQILRYAGRSIQLAREALGHDPEPDLLRHLTAAPSNLPEHGDGARIYVEQVRPAMIDLAQVAAHFVVSSLFESYEEETRIYCYDAAIRELRRFQAGRGRLLVGRGRFASRITGEGQELSFGVFHLGDHNVQAGVREFRGEEEYLALIADARRAMDASDFAQIVRLLDRHFEGVTYSLKSLFRDEQRRAINSLLEATLEEAEAGLRQIHDRHAALMRFLAGLGVPLPGVLRAAGEFVLNASLRRELEADRPDPGAIRTALQAASGEHVTLDAGGLGFALQEALERTMESLAAEPGDLEALDRATDLAALAHEVPFDVNRWRAQNLFYELLQTAHPEMRARGASRWLQAFAALGDQLRFRVPGTSSPS